ncbi:hypothetical protein [Pseudobutyrivibrio sp. MD2005]|uniref:hypothetical protein n=1 Tax=Pseudobutyrivibrio sp. MD2005 TaxID=1410616 RepID=UPI000488E2A2|nr:hypothetical protein [Pseudobutyrivibrio sp. MD2005]
MMNIEQAFIHFDNPSIVKSIVERRLNGDLKELRYNYNTELNDSYDVFLKNDNKRKIAISPEKDGWITIIESKEVNDYTMLIEISKETESEVVAIQQYDSVGAWGYVLINKGEIVDSYFSEDDYDYENMIFDKMKTKGINNVLLLFREVIQMKDENWMFVKKEL